MGRQKCVLIQISYIKKKKKKTQKPLHGLRLLLSGLLIRSIHLWIEQRNIVEWKFWLYAQDFAVRPSISCTAEGLTFDRLKNDKHPHILVWVDAHFPFNATTILEIIVICFRSKMEVSYIGIKIDTCLFTLRIFY